jgi:predicted DNA-binding transcriptional regulator AlpA
MARWLLQMFEASSSPSPVKALISPAQFAEALGESSSAFYIRAKRDPSFPPPVQKGVRRTRYRLSDARRYILGLGQEAA